MKTISMFTKVWARCTHLVVVCLVVIVFMGTNLNCGFWNTPKMKLRYLNHQVQVDGPGHVRVVTTPMKRESTEKYDFRDKIRDLTDCSPAAVTNLFGRSNYRLPCQGNQTI